MRFIVASILVLVLCTSVSAFSTCRCSDYTVQSTCQNRDCYWKAADNECSEFNTDCALATDVSSCAPFCYWNTTTVTPACVKFPGCSAITASVAECKAYGCVSTNPSAPAPCADFDGCSNLKVETTCQYATNFRENGETVCYWDKSNNGTCVSVSTCSEASESVCDSLSQYCEYTNSKCTLVDCAKRTEATCIANTGGALCTWTPPVGSGATGSCGPKTCGSYNASTLCDDPTNALVCAWQANSKKCDQCFSGSMVLASIASVILSVLFL